MEFVVSSCFCACDYEMMRLAARHARTTRCPRIRRTRPPVAAGRHGHDRPGAGRARARPGTIANCCTGWCCDAHRAGPPGAENQQVLLVEQVVSLGAEPLFHAVGYIPGHRRSMFPRPSAASTGTGRPGHGRAVPGHVRRALGRVAGSRRGARGSPHARLLKIEAGPPSWCASSCSTTWPGRPRSYNFTEFRPDRVRFVARHPAARACPGPDGRG